MHLATTPQPALPAVSTASAAVPAPSSRRSLLGLAGAGIAALPVLATSRSAHAEPDAELIQLCARFTFLERRYIDLLSLPNDDEQALALIAAIGAEQLPLLDAICRSRCTTPNGAKALTEAVVVANSELVHRTGADHNGERLCHTLLISLLGGDGIKLEGEVISSGWRSAVDQESPDGVLPPSLNQMGKLPDKVEQDAELIQACCDLNVVTASRRSLYDYENRSISDQEELAVVAAGDLLADDYAEARDRMIDLPCTGLRGLGALATAMLNADVADLSLKVEYRDKEFILIRKLLEQAATYA